MLIEVTNKFGYLEIDLFVTTISKKLQNYVSWFCEYGAKAEDASFLTDWVSKLVIFFLHLVY